MTKADACRQIAERLDFRCKPLTNCNEYHAHTVGCEIVGYTFNPFDSENDSARLLDAMIQDGVEVFFYRETNGTQLVYDFELLSDPKIGRNFSVCYEDIPRRKAIVRAAKCWLGIEGETEC